MTSVTDVPQAVTRIASEEDMDFGIGLLNYTGCWDDAVFAEQHGFSYAGFVDSPLNNGDPFAAMALTANATSSMRLGTFINVPSLRTAAATAAGLSTVNQLAPGRVFYGAGTGDTGRGTFGLPAMGVAGVRNYVKQVRALLIGQDVEHSHAGRENIVRMANKDHIRVNIENPIPVYIAADGPRALQATGEIADGWIATLAKQGGNTMENAPAYFERSLRAVQEHAARAGRDFSQAYNIWTTSICILAPGESAISERALARTGPMATFPFHAYACRPEIGDSLPQEVRDRLDIYERKVLERLPVPRDRLYQEVHAGHLSHLLEGEAEVLTEDIVRMTTLTGTVEEIAGVLRRLEGIGLRNVCLWIPPASFREVVLEVEANLMPLFR